MSSPEMRHPPSQLRYCAMLSVNFLTTDFLNKIVGVLKLVQVRNLIVTLDNWLLFFSVAIFLNYFFCRSFTAYQMFANCRPVVQAAPTTLVKPSGAQSPFPSFILFLLFS